MNSTKIVKIIKDSLGATIEPAIEIGITTILVDSILGQFAGGIFAAKNSYKQKRLENNIKEALTEIISRLNKLESLINERNSKKFKDELLPTFWDYVIDEPENEKIQLFINGLLSTLRQSEINMDKTFIYFEILKLLRVNEIKHFIDVFVEKNYKIMDNSNFGKLKYEPDLDISYHKYVISKLERIGLIEKRVIDGNGTIDSHYSITQLGFEMMEFFKDS